VPGPRKLAILDLGGPIKIDLIGRLSGKSANMSMYGVSMTNGHDQDGSGDVTIDGEVA
jgi:hypothetical protein